MTNSNYLVEFNGSDYVVLFGVRVVAAFANSEEAFDAKRSFEDRPVLSDYDKTPPAMRAAKANYYRQEVH
ncbi:hypothetical protein [Thiomicrorhabdus sp. Kp2]|uniref:hypothetical protein n=1 Tax=Thiomicrorhabdus sp. Kp2 TaxID=1123518 RepID=UPI0003F66ECC|nr:hypothetical protein [Thiomicrorhabdus sp. Kp2]